MFGFEKNLFPFNQFNASVLKHLIFSIRREKKVKVGIWQKTYESRKNVMDILYKSLEVCVAMIFRDDFESEKQFDKRVLENERR